MVKYLPMPGIGKIAGFTLGNIDLYPSDGSFVLELICYVAWRFAMLKLLSNKVYGGLDD